MSETETLEEKAEAFVAKVLRLPYSWLPQDLYLGFQQDILSYAYRKDRQTVLELALVQTPQFRVRAFRNKPNETLDELRARWRAVNPEVEQTFREIAEICRG